MKQEEIRENLRKDEYGLYVNAPNYKEARANIDSLDPIQKARARM